MDFLRVLFPWQYRLFLVLAIPTTIVSGIVAYRYSSLQMQAGLTQYTNEGDVAWYKDEPWDSRPVTDYKIGQNFRPLVYEPERGEQALDDPSGNIPWDEPRDPETEALQRPFTEEESEAAWREDRWVDMPDPDCVSYSGSDAYICDPDTIPAKCCIN